MAIANQCLGKHTPTATDMPTKTKELLKTVFSVQSMQRLHKEVQWGKIVSWE
jgi:hypothetical protein